MSTFDGVIKEYPLISIDKFTKDTHNFQSTVFFLSHCHTDHMRGLGDDPFFNLLEQRGFSKIYVSEVSFHLLKNDNNYSRLTKYLVSLPMEEPTTIEVPDVKGQIKYKVVTTLLTAGHCLGSVMFLIEGSNMRVLYTGDFRLPVGSATRLKDLHDRDGQLKTVDSLYIDTTFCNNTKLFIPNREQCMEAIYSIVEPWLAKGPEYVVHFICPAQYGYEFVFVELFKRLGEKTHVSYTKLRKYEGIKMIEDAVTSIPFEARIHACFWKIKQLHLERERECSHHNLIKRGRKVRVIRPSAMFFTNEHFDGSYEVDKHKNMKFYRVYYSTHSSLTEIKDLAHYIKPRNIYPNVVENQTVEEILELINANGKHNSGAVSSLDSSVFGSLKADDCESEPQHEDSLPFYDDCYKIPIKTKTVPNCGNESSYNNQPNVNEVFPANEIYTKPKSSLAASCDRAIPTGQVLKWDCPLSSSDEENSDPNSLSQNSKSSHGNKSTKIEQDMDCFLSSDDGADAKCSQNSVNQKISNLSEEEEIQCVLSKTIKRNNSTIIIDCDQIYSKEQMSNINREHNTNGDLLSKQNIPGSQPKELGIKDHLSALLSLVEEDSCDITNIPNGAHKNKLTQDGKTEETLVNSLNGELEVVKSWRSSKLMCDVFENSADFNENDDCKNVFQSQVEHVNTVVKNNTKLETVSQSSVESVFSKFPLDVHDIHEKDSWHCSHSALNGNVAYSSDEKVNSSAKTYPTLKSSEFTDLNKQNSKTLENVSQSLTEDIFSKFLLDATEIDNLGHKNINSEPEVVCDTIINPSTKLRTNMKTDRQLSEAKSYHKEVNGLLSSMKIVNAFETYTNPSKFFPNRKHDVSSSKFEKTLIGKKQSQTLNDSIVELTPPVKPEVELVDLTLDSPPLTNKQSSDKEESDDSPSLLSESGPSIKVRDSLLTTRKRKSLENVECVGRKSPKMK